MSKPLNLLFKTLILLFFNTDLAIKDTKSELKLWIPVKKHSNDLYGIFL